MRTSDIPDPVKSVMFGPVAVLIATVVALGVACSREETSVAGETPVARTLDLVATAAEGGIRVTNRNRFDWTDCNVQLNAEPGDQAPWSYPSLAELEAGASAMLAYSDFTHHDLGQFNGERFEGLNYRLLLVTCQTPEGMGFADSQMAE